MKPLHVLAIAAALQMCGPTGATAEDFEAGALRIDDPWSRPTAGNTGTSAVYFEIENKGAVADRLVSAKTDIAEGVELHESIEEGGVAKMQPLQGGIEVPAGGEVKLKPRGMHVMLLGLKQKLEDDQTFPMTLTFERQGDVQIKVEVESDDDDGRADMPPDHSKH